MKTDKPGEEKRGDCRLSNVESQDRAKGNGDASSTLERSYIDIGVPTLKKKSLLPAQCNTKEKGLAWKSMLQKKRK